MGIEVGRVSPLSCYALAQRNSIYHGQRGKDHEKPSALKYSVENWGHARNILVTGESLPEPALSGCERQTGKLDLVRGSGAEESISQALLAQSSSGKLSVRGTWALGNLGRSYASMYVHVATRGSIHKFRDGRSLAGVVVDGLLQVDGLMYPYMRIHAAGRGRPGTA